MTEKEKTTNENKTKQNIFQKVIKIIIYIIVGILLIYNIVIIFQKITKPNETPSFLGYKNFIILSGSMEPTINIGDIIIVSENEEIEIGDIISFQEDGNIITHRITEKVEENGEIKYRTKGDANNTEDIELVDIKNIEGKYQFKIPKIGKLVMLFSK